MTTMLIVYATDNGNTKALAEEIAAGAGGLEGTQVVLKEAGEATDQDLSRADALVLGTPVHMGSPDWRMKKFIDQVCSGAWMSDTMVGKVGAAFATGSNFGQTGGGAELTMLALLNNLAELGMILVPLPKSTPGYGESGLQWGPYARTLDLQFQPTGLTDAAKEAARRHGLHVARTAALVKGAGIFDG